MKYLGDAISAIKADVIALGIPFAQAIENPDLVKKIQREFPGMTFRRAAREAWAELVADGELEIRRHAESGKFGVWFLSGRYTECMWQGDEHRHAALQAIVIERQQFAGVQVVDRVPQPAITLIHRRRNRNTFARGARRIRGKA